MTLEQLIVVLQELREWAKDNSTILPPALPEALRLAANRLMAARDVFDYRKKITKEINRKSHAYDYLGEKIKEYEEDGSCELAFLNGMREARALLLYMPNADFTTEGANKWTR